MGPRPFGRGRSANARSVRHATGSFNGAATFRPRKDAHGQTGTARYLQLQWGRDLSAAEGGQVPIQYMGRHMLASMGPRPFGRGRTLDQLYDWLKHDSFNGAATFRPRKAAGGAVRAPCRSGFNGAATFRPRKVGTRNDYPLVRLKLQWGRDLSAAEGRKRSVMSMIALRFNGAATFRPRKDPRGQPANRGQFVLQWGRDLSAAEGAAASTSPLRTLPASMGPRPFGRGRFGARDQDSRPPVSFNGAATFRPRKAGEIAVSVSGEALQWGRDLSAAEGFSLALRTGVVPSFNGAATFRPRKDQQGGRRHCGLIASMGPRPFGRGRRRGHRACTRGPRASMGPRPFGRGRQGRRASRTHGRRLQWGRDLSAAEGM